MRRIAESPVPLTSAWPLTPTCPRPIMSNRRAAHKNRLLIPLPPQIKPSKPHTHQHPTPPAFPFRHPAVHPPLLQSGEESSNSITISRETPHVKHPRTPPLDPRQKIPQSPTSAIPEIRKYRSPRPLRPLRGTRPRLPRDEDLERLRPRSPPSRPHHRLILLPPHQTPSHPRGFSSFWVHLLPNFPLGSGGLRCDNSPYGSMLLPFSIHGQKMLQTKQGHLYRGIRPTRC